MLRCAKSGQAISTIKQPDQRQKNQVQLKHQNTTNDCRVISNNHQSRPKNKQEAQKIRKLLKRGQQIKSYYIETQMSSLFKTRDTHQIHQRKTKLSIYDFKLEMKTQNMDQPKCHKKQHLKYLKSDSLKNMMKNHKKRKNIINQLQQKEDFHHQKSQSSDCQDPQILQKEKQIRLSRGKSLHTFHNKAQEMCQEQGSKINSIFLSMQSKKANELPVIEKKRLQAKQLELEFIEQKLLVRQKKLENNKNKDLPIFIVPINSESNVEKQTQLISSKQKNKKAYPHKLQTILNNKRYQVKNHSDNNQNFEQKEDNEIIKKSQFMNDQLRLEQNAKYYFISNLSLSKNVENSMQQDQNSHKIKPTLHGNFEQIKSDNKLIFDKFKDVETKNRKMFTQKCQNLIPLSRKLSQPTPEQLRARKASIFQDFDRKAIKQKILKKFELNRQKVQKNKIKTKKQENLLSGWNIHEDQHPYELN